MQLNDVFPILSPCGAASPSVTLVFNGRQAYCMWPCDLQVVVVAQGR